MYQHLLFDLDGTLTDPAEGITNSVKYALQKLGYPVPDMPTLLRFIGPPLYESFQKICGIPEEESFRGVTYYREYFSDKGMFENAVIPGIPELLDTLRSQGFHLHIASAKPEVYVVPILQHFGLDAYFEVIGAATLGTERTHKDEVIAYVLEQLGKPDRREVLMIGDRDNDILGAKACGVDSLGVLFGYGSREELTAAGADMIASAPEEIAKLLG